MSTPTWLAWVDDPVARETGITFDRTPADDIRAPQGMFRVCAYHVDFDERPTCYTDVATLAEAERLATTVTSAACPFNVDYAVTFDDAGTRHGGPPWAQA